MTSNFDNLINELYSQNVVIEEGFVDSVKALGLAAAITAAHLPLTVPLFKKVANDLVNNHPEVAQTIDFEKEWEQLKNSVPPVQPQPAAKGTEISPKPPQIEQKPKINKTTKGLTPELVAEIKRVSKSNGWNWKHLQAVIGFETGGSYDVAQKNRYDSGATGLIQFMPRTADGLGTTIERLENMSQVEQMVYVEKHLKMFLRDSKKPKDGWTLSDMYMAVLMPSAVGKPDSHVIMTNNPKKSRDTYDQNKGLDKNKDNKITKVEAAAKLLPYLPK
tara:strand:+ start:137 stop:961 length:825 start_codon:yes stop_codon:yes gene_type:complete